MPDKSNKSPRTILDRLRESKPARAIALLGAGATLATLTACGPTSNEAPAPAPTTTSSAPAIPGEQSPSATPTPSASETAPSNELQNYNSYKDSPEYAALTAEQKAEIDRMDGLSLEAYNLEKDAVQFAYADFMTKVYKPYTIKMLEKYQQVPNDGRLNYKPSLFPHFDEETLDTPIHEISDNYVLSTTIAIMSMTNGDGKINPEAKDRAIKMLSERFVKTNTSNPSNNHGSVYYGFVDYINNIGDTLDTNPSLPGFEKSGFIRSQVRKKSAVTENPNFSNGPAKMMFFSQLTNGQETAVSLVSTPLETVTGEPVEKWRVYEIGPVGGQGVNFTPIN